MPALSAGRLCHVGGFLQHLRFVLREPPLRCASLRAVISVKLSVKINFHSSNETPIASPTSTAALACSNVCLFALKSVFGRLQRRKPTLAPVCWAAANFEADSVANFLDSFPRSCWACCSAANLCRAFDFGRFGFAGLSFPRRAARFGKPLSKFASSGDCAGRQFSAFLRGFCECGTFAKVCQPNPFRHRMLVVALVHRCFVLRWSAAAAYNLISALGFQRLSSRVANVTTDFLEGRLGDFEAFRNSPCVRSVWTPKDLGSPSSNRVRNGGTFITVDQFCSRLADCKPRIQRSNLPEIAPIGFVTSRSPANAKVAERLKGNLVGPPF